MKALPWKSVAEASPRNRLPGKSIPSQTCTTVIKKRFVWGWANQGVGKWQIAGRIVCCAHLELDDLRRVGRHHRDLARLERAAAALLAADLDLHLRRLRRPLHGDGHMVVAVRAENSRRGDRVVPETDRGYVSAGSDEGISGYFAPVSCLRSGQVQETLIGVHFLRTSASTARAPTNGTSVLHFIY